MDPASYQFMKEERPKTRASGLTLPVLVSILRLRKRPPGPISRDKRSDRA